MIIKPSGHGGLFAFQRTCLPQRCGIAGTPPGPGCRQVVAGNPFSRPMSVTEVAGLFFCNLHRVHRTSPGPPREQLTTATNTGSRSEHACAPVGRKEAVIDAGYPQETRQLAIRPRGTGRIIPTSSSGTCCADLASRPTRVVLASSAPCRWSRIGRVGRTAHCSVTGASSCFGCAARTCRGWGDFTAQ